MRAICEECHLPQPTDWRAGDLCVHCGKAARAESRCFWCVKWTPDGKYCRHCGAETVDEALFGAARMLKDAGTDRFTVPKMLKELPADQIDNFTNIYQRHAVVLTQHIEDLLFLERFLYQTHWSVDLEDRLIPTLPWSDEEMKLYSLPPIEPKGDLERALHIHRSTPIETTRSLAAMVGLRLGLSGYRPGSPQYLGNDLPITMAPKRGELPPGKELLLETREVLHFADPALRAEAALTLSHWRILFSFGFPEDRRSILAELAHCDKKPEALTARAILGGEVDLSNSDLHSDDPDTSFAAALATQDVDRLRAAMQGDRLQRLAAGLLLADMGVFASLADTLRTGDTELQWQLLQGLAGRRDKAAMPELRDVFYELLESSDYERIVELAARLLCREPENVDAMRIARGVKGERSALQSILQSDLTREDAMAVAAYMVDTGAFRMSQYGVSDLATKGKVGDDFVCRQFANADEETRFELCRFAEEQLKERGDEELHRFIAGVALGPYSSKIRSEAWWSLYRWYARIEYGSYGPLKISKEPVDRFFGSMAGFLERLIAVLSDEATLKEVGYAEFMSRLLKYHDPEVLPELVQEARLSLQLRDVLVEAMRNQEFWSIFRSSCADFLGLLAMHDEWLVDTFRILQTFKGTDMEGACQIVIDRLCREYEDLGEGDGRNPASATFDYQASMEREEENSDPR